LAIREPFGRLREEKTPVLAGVFVVAEEGLEPPTRGL
jgi:hypothetical protein